MDCITANAVPNSRASRSVSRPISSMSLNLSESSRSWRSLTALLFWNVYASKAGTPSWSNNDNH